MKTFLRVLAVTVVLQFLVTRKAAGNVIEEGRAERMWMLFPVNVFLNAMAWTLVVTVIGKAVRAVRRG